MDIAFGNGNSIPNLLRGFSHSHIEFGVVITYILIQNVILILVHFRFLRVYSHRQKKCNLYLWIHLVQSLATLWKCKWWYFMACRYPSVVGKIQIRICKSSFNTVKLFSHYQWCPIQIKSRFGFAYHIPRYFLHFPVFRHLFKAFPAFHRKIMN